MSDKKATHIVTHESQYLAVGGKLQHVPKGTEVYLTKDQAEALEAKGRVIKIKEAQALEIKAAEAQVKEAKTTLDKLKG